MGWVKLTPRIKTLKKIKKVEENKIEEKKRK